MKVWRITKLTNGGSEPDLKVYLNGSAAKALAGSYKEENCSFVASEVELTPTAGRVNGDLLEIVLWDERTARVKIAKDKLTKEERNLLGIE